MRLTLAHTLTFTLGTPARAVGHLLLTPLATPQQKVEKWTIEMPGFADAATFRDGYGNRAHLVSQVKPEPEMVVKVAGTVETIDKAGVLGRLEYDPMPAMFRRPTELTKPDPAIVDGLKDGPDRIGLLHEIMGRAHQRAGPSQTQDGQTQSQSQGTATPQDLTHLFIGVARALDIPARYVTGYLWDEGKGSVHAWAEGWDERLGWIGFDPTLNVCPAESYIRLASGLDAMSTLLVRAVPVWPQMPEETVEMTAS